MHHSILNKISASLAVAGTSLAMASSSLAGVVMSDGQMQPTATTGQYEQSRERGGLYTDDLPMLAKGVQELGLSGRLDWTDETLYNLDVSYGRFVTDNWMLGFRAGIFGVNSDINVSAGLFAEYNFLTGTKWVPFAGVGANWARLDSGAFQSDAIQMSGEFGVKYFMRSNMAISASMSGTWASDTLPDGDDFGSRINFGLRFYF